MFLSADWDGRVSDKQISIDSSFFEKISLEDCILSDMGLAAAGATLKILKESQLPGNCQMSKFMWKQLLVKLKDFAYYKILYFNIEIMTVCAIINLNKSVVPI